MSRYREIISGKLDVIKHHVNAALTGQGLGAIADILRRIDSTGKLPGWFEQLSAEKTLPNLDGKTIGSVVEKLLVCVLERYVLDSRIHLHINPAKGVDVPELELGIKSPSENFCTSEPYFSAYERLVGNENDALILLTDYQRSKRLTAENNGLRLQIKALRYLRGAEIADRSLCALAESLKSKFLGDNPDACMLKRAIHFLAYVNQSDWEAARIMELLQSVVGLGKDASAEFARIRENFDKKNARNAKSGKDLLPIEMLRRLEHACLSENGIVLEAENWVTDKLHENWHSPSAAVWKRILAKPLEGKIGMSFALQWRYNFSSVFKDERLLDDSHAPHDLKGDR